MSEPDQPETAEPVSENFRPLPVSHDRLNDDPLSLNETQHAALRLLVLGQSPASVAKAVGVCIRTLYNWRQTPAFAAELERRREELWSGAAERLRAMLHPSLDVLEQHLRDPYDRSRFRAATAVLRLSDLRRAVPISQPQGHRT